MLTYDGTKKEYPNGAMMIFIPLHDGISLSTTQRDKVIFNHESFIGSEEAMCIGSLSNLNTIIKIKGGHNISLRLLLKSLPASQGMSRSQLFQFIEPNISGVTTIATLQSTDKTFIEQRKTTLESEIRKIIEPGEETKVFLNVSDGLWFGGVHKNKSGRVIVATQPSKSTLNHLNHITTILRSPPKKRSNTHLAPPHIHTQPVFQTSQQQPSAPHPITPAQLQQASQAHHLADHLTQINKEFQLQHERNHLFDQHISSLEKTTNKIDSNVETIMSSLDRLLSTTPLASNKQRKITNLNNTTEMQIDQAYPPPHYHVIKTAGPPYHESTNHIYPPSCILSNMSINTPTLQQK
jgi:hypothetical protein